MKNERKTYKHGEIKWSEVYQHTYQPHTISPSTTHHAHANVVIRIKMLMLEKQNTREKQSNDGFAHWIC